MYINIFGLLKHWKRLDCGVNSWSAEKKALGMVYITNSHFLIKLYICNSWSAMPNRFIITKNTDTRHAVEGMRINNAHLSTQFHGSVWILCWNPAQVDKMSSFLLFIVNVPFLHTVPGCESAACQQVSLICANHMRFLSSISHEITNSFRNSLLSSRERITNKNNMYVISM